jgi:hypothetical protein
VFIDSKKHFPTGLNHNRQQKIEKNQNKKFSRIFWSKKWFFGNFCRSGDKTGDKNEGAQGKKI